MSPDLFNEAFFFLNRGEAEKLRLVCRTFDSFCTKLRDVHGYKLEIYSLSIGCTDHWATEPAEFIAYVEACGQFQKIRGTEEELAAGLKAALSLSFVHHCCIYTTALSESLCAESAAFFVGVSVGIVELCRPTNRQPTYYRTIASSKLWKFLLSFDAIGELRLSTKFLDGDLADEHILRCRSKRVRTLKMRYDVELRLQEVSDEELLYRFRSLKPSLISASR